MSTHKFSLLCKLNKRTFRRLKNQFSFTYFLLTVKNLITEQIEFIIAKSYDLEKYGKEFKFFDLMDMDHIGISIFYFFENADDLRIRMKHDLEFTRRIFNRNDA